MLFLRSGLTRNRQRLKIKVSDGERILSPQMAMQVLAADIGLLPSDPFCRYTPVAQVVGGSSPPRRTSRG